MSNLPSNKNLPSNITFRSFVSLLLPTNQNKIVQDSVLVNFNGSEGNPKQTYLMDIYSQGARTKVTNIFSLDCMYGFSDGFSRDLFKYLVRIHAGFKISLIDYFRFRGFIFIIVIFSEGTAGDTRNVSRTYSLIKLAYNNKGKNISSNQGFNEGEIKREMVLFINLLKTKGIPVNRSNPVYITDLDDLKNLNMDVLLNTKEQKKVKKEVEKTNVQKAKRSVSQPREKEGAISKIGRATGIGFLQRLGKQREEDEATALENIIAKEKEEGTYNPPEQPLNSSDVKQYRKELARYNRKLLNKYDNLSESINKQNSTDKYIVQYICENALILPKFFEWYDRIKSIMNGGFVDKKYEEILNYIKSQPNERYAVNLVHLEYNTLKCKNKIVASVTEKEFNALISYELYMNNDVTTENTIKTFRLFLLNYHKLQKIEAYICMCILGIKE